MKKILFTLTFIFAFTVLAAQPDNPPPVPLDGGLALLLAAGVAYGIKRKGR